MKKKFSVLSIFLFLSSVLFLISCKEPEVIPLSQKFSVGDILFSDGTYIKSTDVIYGIPDEQVSKAIAVIAFITDDGRTLGVGLNKGKDLSWATKGSLGYKTNFEKIRAEDSGSVNKGFSFSGDKNGSDNWDYICSIDFEGTNDAEANYPAFNFAQTYGKIAGLEETDFEDGWYVPSVYELYGMYKNFDVIQKSLLTVKGFSFIEGLNQSSYWSSSQSIAFDNKAFQVSFDNGYVDDFYYKYDSINVAVLKQFYINKFSKYTYKNPKITSITIPPAVTGYTGELKITIRGENLKGYTITCDYSEVLNMEYFGDNEVVVTIMCKGVAGEYDVKIKCGSATKVGVLKIGSFQCYEVGDIVLLDGSKVSVDYIDSYLIDENNKPIGVVISSLYGGVTGKIMGIQKTRAIWAPEKTVAYKSSFEGIIATYEGDKHRGFSIGGDLIGSDNWDYICSVDPDGSKNPETNYPIFNFALNYGTTAGLTGTNFYNNWYVPSTSELYDIVDKIDVVQKSLTAAGGYDLRKDELESAFWSSNSTGFSPYYAVVVRYTDKLVYHDVKYKDAYYANNVMVLRDF